MKHILHYKNKYQLSYAEYGDTHGYPIYMQHSKMDDQIPLATAEITAQLLPQCHLDIRESGGHFSDELLTDFIETTMVKQYKN